MNALTTTAPIDVEALVNELAGGMKYERGQNTLARLPTEDERTALQARQIALVTKMRAITYAAADKKPAQLAGAAIAEMLHGFEAWKAKAQDKSVEQQKQDSIGWYVHELRDMPLFAIEAACMDVRENRVEGLNPDWPPSSARMVSLARGHMEAGKKQHTMVKALLEVSRVREPEIDTANKDQRVGNGLRSLADTLAENLAKLERERSDELSKKTIERNNHEIMEEHRALNINPIVAGGMPVSISLRRKIAEYANQDAKHPRNRDSLKDQGS